MSGGRGGRFGGGRGMAAGRGGFGGGRGGPRSQGWETVDRSKQTCVFFVQGKCTKGDACPFSHAIPSEGGVSQAAEANHPPQRAAVPVGRPQPPAMDSSPAPVPAARNDSVPQTKTSASEASRGGETEAMGIPGQSLASVRVSGAGREEARSFSRRVGAFGDGASKADPALAVASAGMTYVTARNGQAHATSSSDQRQGAPGIIVLPDGGLVTRKRAAELQLRKDERGDAEARNVRQRDGREQGRAQERRPTSGSRGVLPVGRVPILDRLGPVTQASDTAPTTERIVAPARIRREAPTLQARKREEPRPHVTPVERPGLQPSSSSSLPRSRVMASALPTRRTGGGRGADGDSTSAIARPAEVAQRKSSALDFKIPTLDEIKSRKAKAEVAAPRVATKRDQALSASNGEKPMTATPAAPAAVEEAPTSPNSVVATTVGVQPSLPLPAPAPTPTVQSDPPQLDAEDMDEFSEWL